MTIDYGHHTLRINRQYDARMRRAMERFKEAVDTLRSELDTLETTVSGLSGGVNHTSLSLDGNTSSSQANPTAAGEFLFIGVNSKNAGGDDHDVTLSGYLPSTNTEYNTATFAGLGEHLFAISSYYNSNLKWFILINSSSLSNV